MKKLLIATIGLFALVGCEDKPAGNVQISGDIKGLSQGKLIIQRLQDTVLKPQQVVYIDGESKYQTSIDLNEPEVLYLFLDRGVSNSLDNNIAFFAEPGKVEINSSVEGFIANAMVIAGKNQDLLSQYNNVIKGYTDKNLEYVAQSIEALQKGNQSLAEELSEKQDRLLTQRYLYTINFCVNNKDFEVSPYVAVTYINDANQVYLKQIYEALSEGVKNSLYGKKLNELLLQK